MRCQRLRTGHRRVRLRADLAINNNADGKLFLAEKDTLPAEPTGADDLVSLVPLMNAFGLKEAGGGRPIFVLSIACHVAMAAFMFGIGSFLAAPVTALSFLVIVPFANRLATRRLRSDSRFVKLGRGDAITQLKIDLDALRDQ